jgi:GNAT superfamily N-acetyltransferase
MQWTRDQFVIDDARERLDMPRIMGWLAESYWAGWRPPAEVRKSWDAAAVVLGLYDGQELIGCARVVSDFTRFSYLSDVFVDPQRRGLGLGRWLVEIALDHPAISENSRWVLHTNDAHGLYEQLGFTAPDTAVMERPRKSAPRS